MSLAIDAIILFAAIIIIWSGTCKGIIRSVMGLMTAVASVFVAYAYTPALASYLKNNFILGKISSGIYETMKSFALDPNAGEKTYNLDKLVNDMPDSLKSILERYNIDVNSFIDKIRGLTSCSEDTIQSIANDIADPTAQMIANTVSFIGLFVVAFIVISLLTIILDFIFKLPVLKTANMTLGFVFGVVEALVFVSILSYVLATLVTSLGSIEPTLFGRDAVDKTIVCKYLAENSFIKGFFS